MASKLTWKGDKAIEAVEKNMTAAMGEFALRAEGYAKKELYKGHGVVTGTARRSIHTAKPGYNWAGDHVEPGPGAPERGNRLVTALKTAAGIVVQLGSGLRYALPLHQGHHGFAGYHFLRIGVDLAKDKDLKEVLEKHQVKR